MNHQVAEDTNLPRSGIHPCSASRQSIIHLFLLIFLNFLDPSHHQPIYLSANFGHGSQSTEPFQLLRASREVIIYWISPRCHQQIGRQFDSPDRPRSLLLECRPMATSSLVSVDDQCMKLFRIFVGQRRFPLLFLILSSPRIKIVNQSNQRLNDYLTSSMTLLLVVTLTC